VRKSLSSNKFGISSEFKTMISFKRFLNKIKLISFKPFPMESHQCKTDILEYSPSPIKLRDALIPIFFYPSLITHDQMKLSLDSVPFKEWLENLQKQPNLQLNSLTFQCVDMFGPRVGFIKFKADVVKLVTIEKEVEGKKESSIEKKPIPNIVFMRGGSVAILVILKSKQTGKEYTILTKQARFPAGIDMFAEIPAGMLDGNGDFKGVAAKEMEEETGLHIKSEHLIDLTEFAWKGKAKGLYLSPGGCDEFIRIFAYEKEVDEKFIDDLKGKLTGEEGSDEVIVLEIVELENLWKVSPDAKGLTALMLYGKYKNK